MNITVLTNNGSYYGKKVIKELAQTGLSANNVIVIDQPISYYWKLFRYVKKRVGLVEAIYFSFKRIFDSMKENRRLAREDPSLLEDYEKLANNISHIGGLNTPGAVSFLKKTNMDLLILGQTGIVPKSILEIPKIGVLNAHPGVLPYYRGMDVYRWAVLNGEFDKIGVSVHWVDAGVDTGDIIETCLYEPNSDTRFDDLEHKLYDLCVKKLVETVSHISKGNIVKGTRQKAGDGKQYYKMPRRLEIISSEKYHQQMKSSHR